MKRYKKSISKEGSEEIMIIFGLQEDIIIF